MNRPMPIYRATSYFWSCITFDEDCPFFSTSDPKLFYFGLSVLSIYVIFLAVIMTDLNLWWVMDDSEMKIDHYASVVKQKVFEVQDKQWKLMKTPTLTEKLLAKSMEAEKLVRTLRKALEKTDSRTFREIVWNQTCILNCGDHDKTKAICEAPSNDI